MSVTLEDLIFKVNLDNEDYSMLRGYGIENIEQEYEAFLIRYKDELLNMYDDLSLIFINILQFSNVDNIRDLIDRINFKYSKLVKEYDRIFSLLTRLSEADYKKFWLKQFTTFLNTLRNNKGKFLEFIKQKENDGSVLR